MKESTEEIIKALEKIITIRIMQEDAETIFSLINTEKNPIFAMAIIPYYALFIQSVQEYMGGIFLEDIYAKKIKDIRNFIKAYGESFGKSKKRIETVDIKQNEQFKLHLMSDFIKDWNIHLNLGTYWTADKHIIGNTQMFADFLEVDDIFNAEIEVKQYELAIQIGSFVSSVRNGFSKVIQPPTINRQHVGINIGYYYDLNTNKDNVLFVDNSEKTLNLFFLNMICNMNFVKYILKPLFDEYNVWVFRVEYIVTYYTYRAIKRLKNHCESNADLYVDFCEFSDIFNLAETLFKSTFRNCMMHYGLENQGLISVENIEKPFYGIIETCHNGMDYYSFRNYLRTLSDRIIILLESKLNTEKIILKHL